MLAGLACTYHALVVVVLVITRSSRLSITCWLRVVEGRTQGEARFRGERGKEQIQEHLGPDRSLVTQCVLWCWTRLTSLFEASGVQSSSLQGFRPLCENGAMKRAGYASACFRWSSRPRSSLRSLAMVAPLPAAWRHHHSHYALY